MLCTGYALIAVAILILEISENFLHCKLSEVSNGV